MAKFYNTFDDIKDNKYDGMIITGAPVEHLEFEQVDYWGRALYDYGMEQKNCLLHLSYLLGCSSRTLLSLWY